METRINYANNGSQYQKYQKPGVLKEGVGVAAGLGATTAAQYLSLPVGMLALEKMQKIGKSCSEADVVEIRKGMEKALVITGMKAKGVAIIDYAGTPIKNEKLSIFGRVKRTILDQNIGAAISEGRNAGYGRISNKVMINTEKFGPAGFHEIGHSINFNNSKFWRALQKYKLCAPLVALSIAGVAILKRKKADGEKPTGFFDRTTTFIKNNAGKLAFGAMVPMIAEEVMASVRGNKLAKSLLSPELAKKVIKSNRWGALSYVGAAAAVGLAATLGSKVRDKIASPKPVQV